MTDANTTHYARGEHDGAEELEEQQQLVEELEEQQQLVEELEEQQQLTLCPRTLLCNAVTQPGLCVPPPT
ncbi:hypothetical protein EYF80_004873 [Liparis tanakae]|uniref:Uncharacterized protein n=1 Tax=Liparis tanakae TaxID=230148 RepID=A0A4Z2J563_9TELE|nr:hypothetical protein EYF80_004873 [Liparis tanakae]